MRLRSILTVALAGSLTGAVAALTGSPAVVVAAPPEFQPFASSAGRYKVVFPGPVKTDSYDVPGGDNVRLKLYVDSVELRGGTAFVVSYVDVTEATAAQPVRQWLDKVRDGNTGPDGKLIDEKDLTVGIEKYPAREVLIEKRAGFLRNRIVIAGRRLYQVMVQGPREVVTSPSADRFFDSFEVTK